MPHFNLDLPFILYGYLFPLIVPYIYTGIFDFIPPESLASPSPHALQKDTNTFKIIKVELLKRATGT